MPDPDTDTPDSSAIASPGANAGPPPGGGGVGLPPGLSGQNPPPPGAGPGPAGEGAPTPTPTAQAAPANIQPGLQAAFRGLMGHALFYMDLAIRLGPDSEERTTVIKHATALAKHFKSQNPQGVGGPGALPPGLGGVPRPPGAAGPMGPPAGGPMAPGTPNLPRGPVPAPGGALAG